MEQTLYEDYAILDAQIKLLTEQKDELKVKLIDEMELAKERTIDTSVGKFTVTKLKTWSYSDKVTVLGEKFNGIY